MKKFLSKAMIVLVALMYSFTNLYPLQEVIALSNSEDMLQQEDFIELSFQKVASPQLKKNTHESSPQFRQGNIPQPKLIEHKYTTADNKKCEIFQYDTSADNAQVAKLREKLCIHGLYASMDSDINLCYTGEHLKFSVINVCLFRLLASIATLENNGSLLSDQPSLENSYIQLIWEVESALPQELDNNDNVRNNGEFCFNFFLKLFPEFDIIVKELIWQYLLIWKRYTARFQNSRILDMAIANLEQMNISN